jgi:hypothetical protein
MFERDGERHPRSRREQLRQLGPRQVHALREQRLLVDQPRFQQPVERCFLKARFGVPRLLRIFGELNVQPRRFGRARVLHFLQRVGRQRAQAAEADHSAKAAFGLLREVQTFVERVFAQQRSEPLGHLKRRPTADSPCATRPSEPCTIRGEK